MTTEELFRDLAVAWLRGTGSLDDAEDPPTLPAAMAQLYSIASIVVTRDARAGQDVVKAIEALDSD